MSRDKENFARQNEVKKIAKTPYQKRQTDNLEFYNHLRSRQSDCVCLKRLSVYLEGNKMYS